jgi:hypothetical protein
VFPDAQVQDYAWMQKRSQSLHQGHLALWNPNTLAGHPFPGEMQTGVFYPSNVIWALAFGSLDGMSARSLDGLVLLHFALAGLGMFLLLHAWDLSPPSSLFGAIVFACRVGDRVSRPVCNRERAPGRDHPGNRAWRSGATIHRAARRV